MSSESKGAPMETNRYVVSVNIVVEATAEDEASMIVERELAGRFDNEVIDVFAEDPDKR
jgi:preprotein translocase subunit SecB